MNYQLYSKRRESHLEWMGEIPAHWSIKKLKYIGTALIGLTYKPDDIVGQGEGILVLRSSNLQHGQIVLDDNVYVNTTIPNELITRSNDILICSRNGSRELVGKNAKVEGVAVGSSFGAFTTVFRSQFNDFLSYVFNSHLLDYQAGLFLTSTINQLTNATLKDFEIPFPPIDEQRAIVVFLDRETGRINALLNKQQRMIELLNEMVTSLVLSSIGSANTKEVRLHGAARLMTRPVSQSEGESYIPIGLFNRGRGLFHKDQREKDEMGDSDFFWIEDGDLIISGQFAWEGAVALASAEDAGCVVSHRYPVLRGIPGTSLTEYLLALLLTTHGNFLLNENSRGAAGRNRPLNINSLLKEKVPLPDMRTQEQIAQAVYWRNDLSIKMSKQAKLLKEHRTALISAAVTGQIDVRNYRPQEAPAVCQ
jgi:type I restriction enzyme S subunit